MMTVKRERSPSLDSLDSPRYFNSLESIDSLPRALVRAALTAGKTGKTAVGASHKVNNTTKNKDKNENENMTSGGATLPDLDAEGQAQGEDENDPSIPMVVEEEDIKPLLPSTPKTYKTKTTKHATRATSSSVKSKGERAPGGAGTTCTPRRAGVSARPGTGATSAEGTASSAKGKMAEMLVLAGIAALDKMAVEQETGMTKAQQVELLKKGRGSMWKGLMGYAAGL